MILYPSIHIKDGKVARLTRSSSSSQQAEVLHPDPIERAASFEKDGFEWLHVVDLDGAFGEQSVNLEIIRELIRTVQIPVQLSGGIRNMKAVEDWLQHGVQNIVLASAALKDPDLVREASQHFPGHIVVKIDSIGGYVARTGWSDVTSTKALDLALRVEADGAAGIIYSDINLDGALSEINVEAIIDLAFALTIPVVAAGGVHSLQDLIELKSYSHAGVAGIILGRALQNGSINAAEALAIARS
jgi:phosphoribosylformimino-5-aminoimidazole carboxamide ribotide isomerase